MSGCPWKHEAAEAPKIIVKFSAAAKSHQNSQNCFILYNTVHEAGSGSHADRTGEEVKKRMGEGVFPP